MIRRLRLLLASPVRLLRRQGNALWAMQHRERERLYTEMQQMRGLLRLLMKPRNGARWTDLERRKIRAQLRQLAQMSPYLILFVSPGGFFALPLLIWWLDRRRQKCRGDQGPAQEQAQAQTVPAAISAPETKK